jgi:hypothetical protein
MLDRLSDPVRRALRTGIQVFVGVFLVGLLGWIQNVAAWASSTDDSAFPSVSPLGKLAVAALSAAATAMVAYTQNAMEDSPRVRMPALLKAPASDGVNPEPDGRHEAGDATLTIVIAVVVVLIILMLLGVIG